MSALAPSTNLIFAAVKKKWDNAGMSAHVTGGIRANEADETTAPPYAVAEPVTDVPSGRTNKGRYRRVAFQIAIVTLTPEQGGELAGHVATLFEDVTDLEIDGCSGLDCFPGPIRHLWDRVRQKQRTILEFTVIVARPRPLRHPR